MKRAMRVTSAIFSAFVAANAAGVKHPTLEEIYQAAWRAEWVYDANPCREIRKRGDSCAVQHFTYFGDLLDEGERKLFLETDAKNSTYWVVFQGTDNFTDAWVDADHTLLPAGKTGLGWSVHEGFWNAAMKLRQGLEDGLRSSGKRYGVRITGHSLGGAMAVIMAELLRKDGFPVRSCITFGQPKVTDSPGAYTAGLEFEKEGIEYIRVVNRNDIVPKVPPVDAPSLFTHIRDLTTYVGLPPITWGSGDMYRHFGQELRLGSPGDTTWIGGKASLPFAWLNPVEYKRASFRDHHMYYYVDKLEALLPKDSLYPRPGKSPKGCSPAEFGIFRRSGNVYSISSRSDCEQEVEIRIMSFPREGENRAVLGGPVSIPSGPDAPETKVDLASFGKVLQGGGWAEVVYRTLDSNCLSKVQDSQWVRAFDKHSLRFRVGADLSSGLERPLPRWDLRAASFWSTWFQGGAEFGLTALKPTRAADWRALQEGNAPLDPFRNQGRRFAVGLWAQAIPFSRPYAPSFQGGIAWASAPGGGTEGSLLYPSEFLKIQMDLFWFNGLPLGFLRAGVERSAIIPAENWTGKGDYLFGGILEAEIRLPFISGKRLSTVLQSSVAPTIWEKDYLGPSLWNIGLLLDLDLAAAGRIFGFTN